MIVRAWDGKDIEQICEIYNYYVQNTVITFEELPVSVDEMRRRIVSQAKAYPWLVCEFEGVVVGYAYVSKWKERAAYRNTSEATVYIRNGLFGRGYGKALYSTLLEELKSRSCHAVLGCIALPNEASVRLHEGFGFRKVGHFNEVGFKFGQWLNVGYWQIILSAK